jgi:hypothetical protein
MDCTVEPFKVLFLGLYTQCDMDANFMSWRELISLATSTYQRLQGRNAWTVDAPRGGALGMAGALVPRDSRSTSFHGQFPVLY